MTCYTGEKKDVEKKKIMYRTKKKKWRLFACFYIRNRVKGFMQLQSLSALKYIYLHCEIRNRLICSHRGYRSRIQNRIVHRAGVGSQNLLYIGENCAGYMYTLLYRCQLPENEVQLFVLLSILANMKLLCKLLRFSFCHRYWNFRRYFSSKAISRHAIIYYYSRTSREYRFSPEMSVNTGDRSIQASLL